MAKIITTRRRRSSGKVKKAAKRAARRVIVQTKKAYRRARSINVTKKDVVVSVVAAGAGAMGSEFLVKKLPVEKLPGGEITANIAIAAIGGYLTYKGVKKRNMALTGAGVGMSAICASNVIKNFTGKSATVNAPYVNPSLAAPIAYRRPALNAPFALPSVAVRTIKDEEYI